MGRRIWDPIQPPHLSLVRLTSGRVVVTLRAMGQESVTLVIPGRNCAATINSCLGAVMPMLEHGTLAEIVFVNDRSTDETAPMVANFKVTVLQGEGRGAAAARNLGWRAAISPLIWFIDSDCVARPDAIDQLLRHLDDSGVGGVGGSYANLKTDSLLACLIHEEIIERHRLMGTRVDFLAGFNVLYRRRLLEELNGFDEHFPAATAEDADLSFRAVRAGHKLHFEPRSIVGHYHETSWPRYLRTQRRHGYWRVRLHLAHRGEAAANAYSGILDHVQPPLAMLTLVLLPLLLIVPPASPFGWLRWAPILALGLLVLAQLPMTLRIVVRTRRPAFLLFVLMSCVRAFWRGFGMVHGLAASINGGRRQGNL